MADTCEHLKQVGITDFPPSDPADACAECLVEGSRWVSLRQCQVCGHVGCCDSSPGLHATKHFEQTAHPVMRSIMPGDSWGWCYVHEQIGELS